MGRLKLPNEYRENSRKRLTTYRDRMKGLKKKAGELSILCGVDVLFASFSPELNTIQCWPEDYSEFRRIAERYSHYCPPSMAKKKKDNVNGCVPSASTPSIQEELASMDKKLIEVRERLRLLENLPLQLGTACPPPPVALPLQLETACPPPPVALPLQLETACPPPPVNIVSSISSAATLAVDDAVDDAYSMRERLRFLEAENL